ncbi:AAA family ATPase [Shewanella inventionis]|uniref:ATP-binding protein n=1 Tax=Shewanella inventionis TaxID=1738770 RepID=UPI0016684EB9|nr:AAA family ATPase [Shewanella inventionis]MCL1156295.1 AAA family ATPase [Shewanella inventionis]UAL43325.1 AAA family ATPase [Shewanella inventionis]
MTASGLLLLPTQEALVQRLQHIASYSEQLLVLCGEKGAGKSTLVAALASELDDYNSALIICPQHADCAEIRRKILVQLISAPIFDDERPLMDTLFRIQSSLGKPLHIIIDDAHLLPKEIWAECILLSQIHCAGKPVAVTMTVEPNFWRELIADLADETRALLLQVSIESLPIAERDGLYQSLLLRSQKTPFIPREIIHKQLEKQSGTPKEVVELLTLAIESPQEISTQKSIQFKLVFFSVVVMLVVLSGWFINQQLLVVEQPKASIELTAEQAERRKQATNYLADYGKQTLAPYFSQRHLAQTKLAANKQAELLIQQQIDAKNVVVESHVEDADIVPLDNHTDVVVNSSVEGLSFQGKLAKAQAHAVSQPQQIIDRDKTPNKIKGFTLQLASVNDKKSLSPILTKLVDEPQVYIMSYKQRFVILLGDFDTPAAADVKAKQLQTQYRLAAPWVRKWADLTEYQRVE